MKILLVSGHTSGHNVSKLTGYNEGDLNIELVNLVYHLIHSYGDVDIYPVERDMYEDNIAGNLQVNFRDYDYILETHFNAYKDDGSARGTSIQLHTNYSKGITVEQGIVDNIASYGFKKRGTNGITRRSDLANMNTCYRLGVDYALLETCFYDSPDDMALYEKRKSGVAQGIVAAIIERFGLEYRGANHLLYYTVSGVAENDSLNVRATPNGAIIGTLKNGTCVIETGRGNDSDGDEWVEIFTGTMSGYVWGDYIK